MSLNDDLARAAARDRRRRDPRLSPVPPDEVNPGRDWTLPRPVQLALIVALGAAIWFGPPVLNTIFLIVGSIAILVWGPQWQRLWLATILGVVLLMLVILGRWRSASGSTARSAVRFASSGSVCMNLGTGQIPRLPSPVPALYAARPASGHRETHSGSYAASRQEGPRRGPPRPFLNLL